MAEGKNYEEARARAEAIDYSTSFSGNRLDLSGLLTTDLKNRYRDQEVQVNLFLPVGTVLHAADNTYSFHRNSDYYGDILNNGDEERYLRISRDGTECLDCPAEEEDPWGDSQDNWDEASNNEEDWTREENGVDGEETRQSIDSTRVDSISVKF
jgi:hypothetical protein